MKNLKKVLSLVLVLVMACGLFATAGAVEYVDDADIKYAEAVDVMSGIGILEGVGGDKFAPKSPVTRAAAAKIIAYLLLGKETADALVKNATQFTDVPAGHWAAGYVQFCANEGIINGKSATVFAPDEGVTTIGFAKLLLGALGYGTKDEFIGAGWEKSVTKYAAKAKIFAGNYAANPEAIATREEAALYAFNALKADKVAYNDLWKDYVSGLFTNDGSLGSFQDDYKVYPAEPAVVTYAAGKFYADTLAIDATEADLGRTVTVWYQETAAGNVAVTAPVYADRVVATTYNGIIDPATWGVYAADNFFFVAAPNMNGTDVDVDFYLNGKVCDGTTHVAAAAKGDKIEFVDNTADGKIDTVLITSYEATSSVYPVVVADNGTVLYGTINANKLLVEGYEDIAANDVVYYTTNAITGKISITKAVVVAGQKTAFSDSALGVAFDSMVFGGTSYTLSGITGTTAVLMDIPFALDYAIALDAAGNVIAAWATAEKPAANFVVLENAVLVPGTGLTGVLGNYYEAKIVKLDGTTEIVKLAQIGTKKAVEGTAVETADKGIWYTYSELVTGNVLTVVNSTNNPGLTVDTAASFVKGNVTLADDVFANEKTVFIVKIGNAYAVYTGYSAMADITATMQVVKGASTNVAQYIYVVAPQGFGTVSSYAFVIAGNPVTYQDAMGFKYDTFKAVVDGKAATLNVKWTGTPAVAPNVDILTGIYAVTYDATGYATIGNAAAINDNSVTAIAAANGIFDIDGAKYAYNANTKAYVVSTLGAVTEANIEAAAMTKNVKAVSIITGVGEAGSVAAQTIVAIYIYA